MISTKTLFNIKSSYDKPIRNICVVFNSSMLMLMPKNYEATRKVWGKKSALE